MQAHDRNDRHLRSENLCVMKVLSERRHAEATIPPGTITTPSASMQRMSPGVKHNPSKFTGACASPTPELPPRIGTFAMAKTPKSICRNASTSRTAPRMRTPAQPFPWPNRAIFSPSKATRVEAPPSTTSIRPCPGLSSRSRSSPASSKVRMQAMGPMAARRPPYATSGVQHTRTASPKRSHRSAVLEGQVFGGRSAVPAIAINPAWPRTASRASDA